MAVYSTKHIGRHLSRSLHNILQTGQQTCKVSFVDEVFLFFICMVFVTCLCWCGLRLARTKTV